MSVAGKAADSAAVGTALAGKAPALESANYPGCYYRTVGGVQEWLNPPMIPSVEYRTTKRHNGKAVYTKLLSYAPSSFTEQNVHLPHDISNLSVGLSINVIWNKDGYQWRHFPSVYYADAAWNGTAYWNGPSTLYFELGASVRKYMELSCENVQVTVEYTKMT